MHSFQGNFMPTSMLCQLEHAASIGGVAGISEPASALISTATLFVDARVQLGLVTKNSLAGTISKRTIFQWAHLGVFKLA